MEITREYIKTLTQKEKEELAEELKKQKLDPVFVDYLIFDKDYKDVKKAS